jgi:trk system potassium uptake protein TrkA
MMNVVIMGCGRIGAQLAVLLDSEGHKVTILDTEPHSFNKLPETFNGTTIIGNGLDGDILRKAGIEKANVFVAVTGGDNKNVMAAQVAKHMFRVPKVICLIYDPSREEIYRNLGLETISPTKIDLEMLRGMIQG